MEVWAPVTGGSAAESDGAVTSCCVRKVLSPSASGGGSLAFGRAFDWASGGVGSSADTLGLKKVRTENYVDADVWKGLCPIR